LLLGVDRFMSEARAITNLIGNAVATMVIARWDGALDLERARAILDGRDPAPRREDGGAVVPPGPSDPARPAATEAERLPA
jgi:aerobic C4-dicarboxylate transport protein